jgi:hypothetical protein
MAYNKYKELSDREVLSRAESISSAERKAQQKWNILSEIEQKAFQEWSSLVYDEAKVLAELRRRGLRDDDK